MWINVKYYIFFILMAPLTDFVSQHDATPRLVNMREKCKLSFQKQSIIYILSFKSPFILIKLNLWDFTNRV